MKFIGLNSSTNRPCNIIKFKDSVIMIDCGLDQQSSLCYLPLSLVNSTQFSSLPNWFPSSYNFNYGDTQFETELKETSGRVFIDSTPEFVIPQESSFNFNHVDLVLVSNYLCMLALPFITERGNFQGTVYATEPTFAIAKQFMEELLDYVERCPKTKEATKWKKVDRFRQIPFPINLEQAKPYLWQQLFTREELRRSLLKVKVLSYAEKVDVFGCLQVTAISSGHCLGSCNWTIESAHEKIVCLSSSSTFTTHPKPMELEPLKKADVLLLTNLTQTPTLNPDSMLNDLCTHVAATLKNGGSVLLPCYSSGIIFDLFEYLVSHLDQCSLGHIPLYFLSPVADQSLAYANILAEWLTKVKANRVFLPEEPFPHNQLIRSGRLKHFPGIYSENFSSEYKQPCVVFAGHPSLRFGDIVHLIQMWKNSPSNLLVFSEPEFPYMEALLPYQPIQMKVLNCPIDTSLTYAQANKLIRDLAPQRLILPATYTQPPTTQKHRTDLVINLKDTDIQVFPYKSYEPIKIPLTRKLERIEVDSDLANSLTPIEIRPGLLIGTITGTLAAKDNKFELKPLNKTHLQCLQSTPGVNIPPAKYTYGALDVTNLMQRLIKSGIFDAKLEQTATGALIQMKNGEAVIRLEENRTHICCESKTNLRLLLKDLVSQCLKKF